MLRPTRVTAAMPRSMKKPANGATARGEVDGGGTGGGAAETGADADIRYLRSRDEGRCSSPRTGQVPIVSDIQVGDLQRIVFDEVTTRFDHIAHQGAEDLVGSDRILDAHLQQATGLRVHRGIPQLLRI